MDKFLEKSAQLSPEMIQRFKTAPVSESQQQTLTQSIIIYDNAHLPSGERIGELDDQCTSHSVSEDSIIKWQ
jgi:hypothetical protein